MAAGNPWSAIWPELSLGCLALLLLVLETVLPKALHGRIPPVSIAGQLGILAVLAFNFDTSYRATFSGLLMLSPSGQLMRVFFLLSSIMVSLLALKSLSWQRVQRVEFHHVVLVVAASMMLLVESRNFVMLFVALETVTVGLYILVSYYHSNPKTLEAGLKYLVMGALSSALLLFGIVLLYGVAGSYGLAGRTGEAMQYAGLAGFLEANPHNFLAAAGIVLVLSGVAFKIGAFPFQIWIPDVYQGAPTPVTAFLAVASKAAGFVVLLILVTEVFVPYAWLVAPVLTIMAAATILFGNLAALKQNNVKRLIGLSGVSHAGFILLAVVSAARVPMAIGAVYFYLYAYLIASFAVFGVMTVLAGPDDTEQELGDYAGLARESPFLAAVLACGLGSLAGIPPFAGFMAKLFVFVSAFKAGHFGLIAVAVAGVVISIYYYFGWIRTAYFSDEAAVSPTTADHARGGAGLALGIALAALTLASILLGFYQGPLGSWVSGR
ncbi:MAG TPA: NADH-quinone oxidoreductase subunit N [Opitutaceae bacterium]|nr:NADH-quinone oxidoreductase subunit N [Opitutaceae bacterium]